MSAQSILVNRAKTIQLSTIAQLSARAATLRAEGRPVISLGFGEPDFDTPAHIRKAAQKAMDEGKTRYPATGGTAELKAAIQQKFKRDNNLSFEANEIIVSTGAKHVLFNGFFATLEEGDEVIIPAPYWTSYPDIVSACDANPVHVQCSASSSYKLTPEALESAITPKTKWLLLNSPSNPTGAVYSADELEALATILRKHPGVWILSDDIYEHIRYTDTPYATMAAVAPDLKDRTLTVNGVSKAYAMTGWRIGYGAGPAELIKAMTALQGQATSGANTIAQAASVEALNASQDCVTEATAIFKQRRDLVVGWLNECEGLDCQTPEGAFYAFPNCAALFGRKSPSGKLIENVDDLAHYVLEEHDVTIIPGTAFGAPEEFRISYAASTEMLEEACKRIKKACLSLQKA